MRSPRQPPTSLRHAICVGVWVFAAVGSFACTRLSTELGGRPCAAGACLDGEQCHPETHRCVPAVRIACGDSGAWCPSEVRSGDSCDAQGAFLPCAEGFTDCSVGCRTCTSDGTWSACSAPSCVVGEVWSCSACGDNCLDTVANATPACDPGSGACSYDGTCRAGYVDTDLDPRNGCECKTTGDAEYCDNLDNDCDGDIDEEATCPTASTCEAGTCVACPENDPNRCGVNCLVCPDAEPLCNGGQCECSSTSCAAGQYCNNGSCAPCGQSDVDHCGPSCLACAGTTPACNLGACRCTASSCGPGNWCQPDGTCAACDTSDHCGPSCGACAAETPVCGGGICECTSTSCVGQDTCVDGECILCNEDDACGPTCVACAGNTPTCLGSDPTTAACGCVAGGCPTGSYCDGGTCQACACQSRFPLCVDLGDGNHACRCEGSSCGTNFSCVDSGGTCRYFDDLESASTVTVCPGAETIRSNWVLGDPRGSGVIGACASGSSCWATDNGGTGRAYQNCELSCVQTPALNLAGFSGTVTARFALAYRMEVDWDGISVRFANDSGGWVFLTPESPGWDVDDLIYGDYSTCTALSGWPGVNPTAWPAFGTYGSRTNPFGWETKEFVFTSDGNANLCHAGFRWRVYLVADAATTETGPNVDDFELLLTP